MRGRRRIPALLVLLLAAKAPADSVYEPPARAVGRLPSYLLEIPASVRDVLVADAGSATMYRFSRLGDGFVEMDRRYMSIGQKGVGKERARDRKTPLGVYFISEELDASRLAEKYGAAAFPLDYPNAWDRYNGRTGYGIWLHGVDARAPDRPPLDTDGCLALPNDDLLQLALSLRPQVTPVIVTRDVGWSTPSELADRRDSLRRALEDWRSSQERGDLHTYLSLYHPEFRAQGMNRAQWASYRLASFAARPASPVGLAELLLLADPEEEGLYISRFEQTLALETGPVRFVKRLYWRLGERGDWQIVAEDTG
ncbi:MAG: L,D-transpeptidase family protein [Gammaproteobacteria bacterium]|nr:L,D-transpeptidase family protein [Gammaproteobacteria bacterium]MDH4255869.1 L,D-transpeptidase family protein [Gammaproteobacteria bacterium]MDH5310651.1 L,D-transpeptidase family protein [Gammaproteobacteria bacterium]